MLKKIVLISELVLNTALSIVIAGLMTLMLITIYWLLFVANNPGVIGLPIWIRVIMTIIITSIWISNTVIFYKSYFKR